MCRFGAAAREGGRGPVTVAFLRVRFPVKGGLGSGVTGAVEGVGGAVEGVGESGSWSRTARRFSRLEICATSFARSPAGMRKERNKLLSIQQLRRKFGLSWCWSGDEEEEASSTNSFPSHGDPRTRLNRLETLSVYSPTLNVHPRLTTALTRPFLDLLLLIAPRSLSLPLHFLPSLSVLPVHSPIISALSPAETFTLRLTPWLPPSGSAPALAPSNSFIVPRGTP
jgi:hypothetical protein